MSRATHLKIKNLTLAAESRFIRREERRMLRRARASESDRRGEHLDAYRELHEHRVHVVRATARVNHLAAGFLRGTAYAAMEVRTAEVPPLHRVWTVAARFGGEPEAFAAWFALARAHVLAQGHAGVPRPVGLEV